MKNTQLIFFAFCLSVSTSFAQQFPVDTLVYNGSSESRVNFVIIGDGYLASQQDNFLEDARKITDDLFRASPFTEYEDYFNVFTISVPSNVEGAAEDPSALIDNYFGSTFNFAGIQRLLVPTRTNQILNVMADNIPDYDQVMVVVNDTQYGGSGGQFATSSVNEAASEISIHEIGHSFAGLADEYWAGAQFARERPNMTRESSESRVKWSNWTTDRNSEVGVYPHDVDPNWYKPHLNCKMQFLGRRFCAVCKEQFIQSIYGRVSHVVAYNPVEEEALGDVITFDLTTINPSPNTLNITWLVDDEEVAANDISFELDVTALDPGEHEVKVVVYDSTALDRRGRVFVSTVSWTLDAGLSSESRWGIDDRPADEDDNVVTAVSGSVATVALRLYPNPTADVLHFTYDGLHDGEVKLSLLELNGKEVFQAIYEVQVAGAIDEQIDIAALPAGIYLVAIDAGDFQKTFRISKE